MGFKRHNIIWILELDLQVKAPSIAIVTANLKELRCKTILNNMVSLEFVNSDSVLQLNSHFTNCSVAVQFVKRIRIDLELYQNLIALFLGVLQNIELRLRCSCGSCHSFTRFAVYLATSAVFGLLL